MSKKIIPSPPWAAPHFWSLRPDSLTVASVAFFGFGVGDGLVYRSGLGNSPWTVLAEGVSKLLQINIGLSGFLISALILMLWFPLHIRMGLGTLLNVVIISFALGLTADFVSVPKTLLGQSLMCLFGIVLTGVSSAIYLSCNLGSGPRDGVMVACSLRFGWKLSWTRTALELFACASGALLGGTVYIGTLLFALLVGPVLGKTVEILAKLYPAPENLSS